MRVEFTPKRFGNTLAEQTVSKNGKWIQRIFSYDKSSNSSMPKPHVMIQNIVKKGKNWLVTDYEIFDGQSGKLVKSLKKDIKSKRNFETTVQNLKSDGTYDTIKTIHKGKKAAKVK